MSTRVRLALAAATVVARVWRSIHQIIRFAIAKFSIFKVKLKISPVFGFPRIDFILRRAGTNAAPKLHLNFKFVIALEIEAGTHLFNQLSRGCCSETVRAARPIEAAK